jgi:hypothetical protein
MTDKQAEGCGAFSGVVIFFFLSSYVFYYLWDAIVVPEFHAPDLGYWQVCGLRILLNILTPRSSRKEDKP